MSAPTLIHDICQADRQEDISREDRQPNKELIYEVGGRRTGDFSAEETNTPFYSKSDNAEKACHYLTLSGEKAANNYSHHEALSYYRQAIMILAKQPESKGNKGKAIEVIRQMTIPRYLSYPEDSLQILQKGENLSMELEDENSLAYFYSRISYLYAYKGESQLALEYGEKAYWQAEKVRDLDTMVQISFGLLVLYNSSGQLRKVIEIASRTICLIEETQRQKDSFNLAAFPYPFCCVTIGLALTYLGNFDEAQVYLEKGLNYSL